jgi:hypothetical protein
VLASPSRVRGLFLLPALHETITVLLVRSGTVGKDYFGATPKPACQRRALPREISNFSRAAPGKSEAGAAVAVVVNDGAAVAQLIALEAHA